MSEIEVFQTWSEERARRRNIRNDVLYRLWSGVTEGLEVRHPDPATRVTLHVMSWGSRIVFSMENVADTRFRAGKVRIGNGGPGDAFELWVETDFWPGVQTAELFLAGAWAWYVVHETMELVTHRHPLMTFPAPPGTAAGMRVIDPHDPLSPDSANSIRGLKVLWGSLENCPFDAGGRLEWVLGMVTGLDRARSLAHDPDRWRAADKEFAAAIRSAGGEP